ncbi:arabinan endo-1,5-alpha-L-arabinosidase [Lederbergia galactosidilyticus]|nr:arabinan endo-1,5-alpha-L-arabinosidase [Lederbergia galactosidilytica]
MYYNSSRGDSPRSAIGVAVADDIEGPYKDLGVILKSGMIEEPSEDGTPYDATVHPNVVDPHVFFDQDNKLWMVYGSYSGGLYILKIDPDTAKPYPEQGYGKKLLGANHSRIEGPYIQYSQETGYYYLFLSFGGLAADGGYNLRVARSKNPDGPYYDSEGNNMIDAHGPKGSFFEDNAIKRYGAKLIGNFMFLRTENEVSSGTDGYVSPGHNSTFYDEDTGKYFVIFHTRFPNRGEQHEIRVHQMFMNEADWPVIAPNRYAGETIEAYSKKQVIGEYKLINHGKDISKVNKKSVIIHLEKDGSISGNVSGNWKQTGDTTVNIILNNITYRGIFLNQWDETIANNIMTFTALSDEGIAIWGKQVLTE